jgi:hypothetical protein
MSNHPQWGACDRGSCTEEPRAENLARVVLK